VKTTVCLFFDDLLNIHSCDVQQLPTSCREEHRLGKGERESCGTFLVDQTTHGAEVGFAVLVEDEEDHLIRLNIVWLAPAVNLFVIAMFNFPLSEICMSLPYIVVISMNTFVLVINIAFLGVNMFVLVMKMFS
jgi:hypothetical protein